MRAAKRNALLAITAIPLRSDELLNAFEMAEKLDHVESAKLFLDDALQYNSSASNLSELIKRRKAMHTRARGFTA